MITLRMMLRSEKVGVGQRYLDTQDPAYQNRTCDVTEVDGTKVTLSYTEHGTSHMFNTGGMDCNRPTWLRFCGSYWEAGFGREEDLDRFVLLRGRVQA
ncbi:MAG: hypothetical protein HYT73_04560 [Candidatus Aenigmarchaeota archaeon]|nr:hypothetical protein [Candidatus Aenigmarchaeota archaeon]